jgi:MarR family transcriptional regulator, organic hydroperoxide resistance regulator
LDVLDVVVHDGGLNPKQLAARTGIHPATLTGVLPRLFEEGWVTRTRDPIDGRSVLIQLEPTRVAQLELLYAPANELHRQTLDRLTAATSATILRHS